MARKKAPVAFVAMRFGDEHWRDKRYIAINEELERAGFSPLRADEIRTSGPVVDEVCRLLREAALVVIDSTGDSQSVSYEIGYCHGAGRAAETTLLLRMKGNALPFNYQHYRHRIYKDLRDLRRLMRDYLGVYEPLSANQDGYTFVFDFAGASFGYVQDGAACIFEALQDVTFSGRCECYIGEQLSIPDHLFSIGVMLRFAGRKPKPDYKWWMKLKKSVARHAKRYQTSITFESDLSELATKRAMLATLVASGIAEFSKGKPNRLLGSDEESILRCYCTSRGLAI